MEASDFPSTRHAAQDLSHAAAFALGPLAVDPPSRRVSAGDRSEMLEPRVMRVLVALGEAGGKVLSRDDLIEECWDGVVIGDNAINQVISRLRRVFADLGGDAVRLETITKVGFRLMVDGQAAGVQSPVNLHSGEVQPVGTLADDADASLWHRKSTRRAAALGLVAAGGAAALGYAGWSRWTRHVPDPRAVALYERGQAIQKAIWSESSGEAIEACKQAAAIDPRYADAWAGIARGYRFPQFGASVQLGDPQAVRTAAGRALALDPDNADAKLALIAMYPLFRHWLEREARLHALLTDHPDSAFANILLAELMFDVGRLEDALAAARRIIEIDPKWKLGWIMQMRALNYAGRFSEGGFAFEQLRSRWPEDRQIWFLGHMILTHRHNYAEAIAYLRDTTRRPGIVPAGVVESMIRRTEAMATGSKGNPQIGHKPDTMPAAGLIENFTGAVPEMVTAGMTDEAFALADAYFFGGVFNGTRVAPPGPLDTRSTSALFEPEMLPLRSDPRFASLLTRVGLEDYWRKSGTQPYFRRGR